MKYPAIIFAIVLMAFGFASTAVQANDEVVNCDINPDYEACSLYTENGEIDGLNEFADNEGSKDGEGSSSNEDDRAVASTAVE